SPRMVEATADAKKRAMIYISGLAARGSTHTYDALKTALDMKVESIYILTDGEPTGGQIVAPNAILAAIYTPNRLLGPSIHPIAIGPGRDGSMLSQFLQGLAEQNYGQYRKID